MPTLKSVGAIYTKKEEVAVVEEADSDPYNVLMRELAFESKKGMAQERLKTEEEIIAEEKERLEKMEADRVKRMKGDFDADIDGGDETLETSHDKADTEEGEDEEEDGDEEEEEGSDDGEEEEESDDDEEDAYSDLEESDNDEAETSKKAKTKGKKTISKAEKKQQMEEAKKQIPFTFKVPESYEELSGHFEGRSPSEKATILERIIKCNHPQFGDDNKAR